MLTCCEIVECELKVGVGEMPPLLLGRFFNLVSRVFHDERPWERGWVFMWLSLSAESVEQARDYEVAIVFMRRV